MKKILATILSMSMGFGAIPAAAKESEEVLKIDFDEKLMYENVNLTYFDDGIKGQCVWFNGGTSYIELEDDITKGVDDFTFGAWLNMTGLEKGWQRIFDFGTGEGNYVFFGIPHNTANLRVAYKIDGGAEWSFDAENVMQTNKWIHVALTQKGKSVKIYVDGKAVAEGECEYTLDDLNHTFNNFIGRSQFANDPKLNAYADEIFFEKRAMSDEEIAEIAKKPELKITREMLEEAMAGAIEGKDSIRENINLPNEILGYGVKWQSSDEEIVCTSDIENGDYIIPKGKVTRTDKDEVVILSCTTELEGEEIEVQIPVVVEKKPDALDEMYGYFYVYFRGYVDGSEEHLSIHIAASEDGYQWFDLNDNKPILESDMGPRCLRDPYLLRCKDGDRFYLLATDLNTQDGQGWGPWSMAGSKYLMVWESDDLVNWSEQRMVKFANESIGCAWAPEAIWDPDTEEYLVYASGKDLTLENPGDTVYVARTRDFRSFSEPEYFVAPVNDKGERIWAIDSNILHADDGKFYHFYKQSGHIEMMVSDHASGPYEYITSFPRPAGEGPGSFKVKNKDNEYCLLVDDYSVYVPYLTSDIASGNFKKATDTVIMPTGSKHGGFLPVTKEEYDRIMDEWYYVSRFDAVEEVVKKAEISCDVDFDEPPFKDTDDIYAQAAAANNIVTGTESGIFDGDRCVTAQELAIMVLRAVGEDDDWSKALENAKKLGVMDEHFENHDKLTHKELQKIIRRVGKDLESVFVSVETEKIRDAERENPERIKQMEDKAITYGDATMKYTLNVRGVEPEGGYPVYIALHGGGGSDTPDLNNSQWQAMQTYYLSSVKEGIYVAPRGVRDTWDTHFNPESYECYKRLLENLAIFYNVNPDRIYLMGYSAGGDGVYQITVRMADYFAAANMSAGHPNGVDLTNVGNMPLYLQCGELDDAYDRNAETVKYGENENVVKAFLHMGKGHQVSDNGLNMQKMTDGSYYDTNAVRLVNKHERETYPEHIVWNKSLKKSDMFYYAESKATEGIVEIKKEGNVFTVTGDCDAIYVNNKFIDCTKPIVVVYNGKEMEFEYKFDENVVRETYKKRFDLSCTFTQRLDLKEN